MWANATCTAKVRENVGQIITEGHIKQLAGKYLAKAKQADDIMTRSWDLSKSLTAPHFDVVAALGDMAVNLIYFVLEISDEFKSMDEISGKFIKEVTGGGQARAELSTTSVSAPSSSTSAAHAPNVVAYGDGVATESNAGAIAVSQAGFMKGSFVYPTAARAHQNTSRAECNPTRYLPTNPRLPPLPHPFPLGTT